MTHAVITGPIRGTVTLSDGTVVDVKPDVVFVDSADAAAEVAQQIGVRLEEEGHPAHDADVPFVYTPAADDDTTGA